REKSARQDLLVLSSLVELAPMIQTVQSGPAMKSRFVHPRDGLRIIGLLHDPGSIGERRDRQVNCVLGDRGENMREQLIPQEIERCLRLRMLLKCLKRYVRGPELKLLEAVGFASPVDDDDRAVVITEEKVPTVVDGRQGLGHARVIGALHLKGVTAACPVCEDS